MATFERDGVEDLLTEADVIAWRLSERYSRAPDRRKEARLDMTVADTLQRRRDVLTFEEFSSGWNKRNGEMP